MKPMDLLVGQAVASARAVGEDRALMLRVDGGVLLAVADGAGGLGGGALAAEEALGALGRRASTSVLDASETWVTLLSEIDARLSAGQGQCALVAVLVAGDRVMGASV